MSWLGTLGKDVKGVFAWLGSQKGQAVIATGEAVAEGFGAPAAVINMANYWMGKALTIQAISVAAGQENGTGTQKAAAVIADVTPVVLSVAKQYGLPEPTSESIANANTYLVKFLQELGAATTPVAPVAPVASASAPAPVGAMPAA